jgi:hypothetical protein
MWAPDQLPTLSWLLAPGRMPEEKQMKRRPFAVELPYLGAQVWQRYDERCCLS